jgi:uncharacterized protein (DUF1800 family)
MRTQRRRSLDSETLALLKQGGSQNGAIQFARRSTTGLEPYTGAWDYAHAAHLLRRAMIGPTEGEIRQAVTDGLDATLARLFTTFQPDTTIIKDWAGQDPQIRPLSTSQADLDAFQQTVLLHTGQINAWWLNVIATSPVSIQERMTTFWHNHFTSELQVVNLPEFMYGQNQLLRRNALGNLKQFVRDVTKDMAMLIYLDGIKNYKSGSRDNINENYARELQELFTMGVIDWNGNANYTQSDVSEAARGLSGYSGTPSSKGSFYAGLASQFVAGRWDGGEKTFLGKTGTWNADDIVDIIFSERADQVAKFVCGKLYRAFVYDILDPVIVTQMADTLRSNNWEIRPVIELLLKSAHFFDDTNIGDLEKSPVDYMLGMIRGMGLKNIPDFVSGGTGRAAQDLYGRMDTLGQTLLDPPNVKGWPGGRTWISTSTLPVRQKFGIDVANGALKTRTGGGTYTFDPIAFARTFPNPDDIHDLAADMALYFLNTPPSQKEGEMLFNTLLDGGVDYEWKLDDPAQKPDVRIRKLLGAIFQLAKYQLY